MKKVLLLDIINIEQKDNFQYLEASLTGAIRSKLKENFVFKEPLPKKIQEVAELNFLFREDFHTKSTAINLGLLAKQDIVISGGYIIKAGSNKGANKRGEQIPQIVVQVRIFDLAKKKAIAEFTETGPANNRVFETVKTISERIAKEAQAILPSKDQWSKTGIVEEAERKPLFTDPVVGLRMGGAMYALGYADRLTVSQPTLALSFRGSVPYIWQHLTFGGELTVVNHFWKQDFNDITKAINFDSTNYLTAMVFGFNFTVFKNWGLHPEVLAGYVLQNTTISGAVSLNTNNSFPFLGGGLEVSYTVNRLLEVVLEIKEIMEFESNTVTLLNSLSLGINLKL